MNDAHDPGHGSSPAAWTAVIIMLIAVTAGTVFFWLDLPVFVIASAVLLALGPVAGAVVSRAGYGVGGAKTSARH